MSKEQRPKVYKSIQEGLLDVAKYGIETYNQKLKMAEKLSFEDWKNSDEVSYDLPKESIIDTEWAKAQNKSPEELQDILLNIVYQDYLEQEED